MPSFEISVGCDSSVAKISVDGALGSSVLAIASVDGALGSSVLAIASVDGALGSSVLAIASVDGVVSVISSAYVVLAKVASNAVVKIIPQSPYAFDLTNPSLMFLFDIYNSFTI